MKNKLVIIFSLFMISCSNNEANEGTSQDDLYLVTGINCRQNSDDTTFKLGNPNVFVNDQFLIYPNPSNETLVILGQQNVTDIWFVPANAKKIYQDIDFNAILNSNLYSETLINSNSTYYHSEASSNTLNLNLNTLQKGYYKVFVKIGGTIYWDNLYKYDNNGNNEQQFTTLLNFWN